MVMEENTPVHSAKLSQESLEHKTNVNWVTPAGNQLYFPPSPTGIMHIVVNFPQLTATFVSSAKLCVYLTREGIWECEVIPKRLVISPF